MSDLPLRFAGTPDATLQTWHDALATKLAGGSLITDYVITGRAVSKMSALEAAQLLNQISNELARRKTLASDGTEIAMVEFGDLDDGPPWRWRR